MGKTFTIPDCSLLDFAKWLCKVVWGRGQGPFKDGYIILDPTFPDADMRSGKIDQAKLKVDAQYQHINDDGRNKTDILRNIMTFEVSPAPDGSIRVRAICKDNAASPYLSAILAAIEQRWP